MKFFLSLVSLLYMSRSEARTRNLQGCLPEVIQVTVPSCDSETVIPAILAAYPDCTIDDVLGKFDYELVDDKCAEAYSGLNKLPFSEVLNKGYQYDKEFFHGGTDLNSIQSYSVDHAYDTQRLEAITTELLSDTIIKWPDYLPSFESCSYNAAMCCWTADKYDVGNGTCDSSDGCADADPVDNTDVCHVNMRKSRIAARTKKGVAVYLDDSEGPVNCQGFAWDDKDGMFKGNALFHTAMEKGLVGNGYVRNVPGAPMCGCVEQMPVVSTAGCSDTVVELLVTLSSLPEPSVAVGIQNISFGDCDGEDLASHYESRFDGGSLETVVVGDCSTFNGVEKTLFLKGYVKKY